MYHINLLSELFIKTGGELLTEHMKLFMEVEAWIHAFLNLPVDGREWSYL
jgi:hypothetical protein